MNITLTEIKTRQDRLREEIMERECILAALDVVAKHVANGRAPSSIDLRLLLPTLTLSAPTRELQEVSAPAPAPAPEPAALPPPPPVELYMHPELKALGRSPADTVCVRWAIGQMTRDYSSHHISALLLREGRPVPNSNISVVLSRLKREGKIEQVNSALGPIPALFRRPEIAREADFQPLDEDLKLPPNAEAQLERAAMCARMMESMLADRASRLASEVPAEV